MKIVAVESFLVAPRWLFCRIETDSGLVGWGEPIVEGRAELVQAGVAVLAEQLAGADPLRIEDHWQSLSRSGFYRGGPVLSSVVAGIDQALWDIAGQHYGAPVHALLGGPVRDRVRIYTSVGGDDRAALLADARRAVAAGFTAVKMNGSPLTPLLPSPREQREIVEEIGAVRAAIGEDVDLAVDFHGRLSYGAARTLLPALAEHRLMFVEEPLLPELGHRLGDLVAACDLPIATGERLYSRTDFRTVLDAGVAIVQPDLSHAGGISEVRRIAAQAETAGALVAPHCPLGPIALAASLQLALATPNFLIQEQALGLGYRSFAESDAGGYLLDGQPLTCVDGYLQVAPVPGLGLRIDEAAVRSSAVRGHAWRPPLWRHVDGSYAEW